MVALPTKHARGLALIVVLWMLSLLMIMAGSFSLTIRRETAVLGDLKMLAQTRALAEAGIYIAMLNLLPPDEISRWRSDSSIYEVEFANARIRIRISDESGKIDINQGSLETLRGVFNSLGLLETQSEALAAAIIDWRDSDEILTPSGAEKVEYQKAGLSYVPPNQPFQTLEELQMVLGMTPELYQQLEPLLTLFSTSNTVNPAKASRAVLLTLPNVTPEMVEAYLQQRADNARAGLPEQPPTWASGNQNVSQVYEIVAEATVDEAVGGAMSAVVRRGQSRQGLPFSILKWGKHSTAQSLFAESNQAQVLQP